MSVAIQILGAALTALREALRSRVILVLFFLGAIMLGILQLFPSMDPEEAIRFITSWSLGVSIVVGGLALIFLVGPAIAREIEEKKIQPILAKPVSGPAFLFGRLLGYGVVTFLIFGGMGVFTYLFLAGGVGGDFSNTRIFQPSRQVVAGEVEVEGRRMPSQDWEVGEWLAIRPNEAGEIRYFFRDVPPLPEGEDVKLLVMLPGSLHGDFESFAPVVMRVENLATKDHQDMGAVIGDEVAELDLPRALFQGGFQVKVRPTQGFIGLDGRDWPHERGVRLLVAGQGSTLINIITWFIVSGLGVFLVISAAALFSILISGKLAIFLSIAVLLAGYSPAYTHMVGPWLEGEFHVEGGHDHSHDDGHNHSHDGEQGHGGEGEKESPFARITSILAIAADAVAAVLPDLEQFGGTADLVAGYNFGFSRLFELILYFALYFGVFLLCGGFVLMYREF